MLRSIDPGETARLLVYAGRQLARTASGLVTRGGYQPRGRRRIQLLMLQTIPHVGATRARALLEAFGSVQGVLMASQSDLEAVSGVGRTTAAAIRHVVSEPPATTYAAEELDF